jgi:rubrerythrin
MAYKTEGNLQTAFAEECQAYCRYIQFAAQAEAEGMPEAARLFRAAAEAEMVHVRNHFSVMGGVGSTKDNLLAATTSEDRLLRQFYPAFKEKAGEEQNERAKLSFDYALKSEMVHHDKFEAAFEAVKAGQKIKGESYLVCRTCGNVASSQAPAKCEICGKDSAGFSPVN